MSSSEKNKVPSEGGKGPAAQKGTHSPGEGIRSLKTSSLFRALNFELYAKPNKRIMALGLISLAISGGYLLYLNFSYDKTKFYAATNEDGTKTLLPKKSRWES